MTATELEEWLSQASTHLPVWRTILWLFVAYLLALGVTALWWPGRARSFLGGFAADWRKNLLEAVVRGVAGLSLIAVASTTRAPEVSRFIGLLLLATAVLMALLPRVHRRFAQPATRFVGGILPLFGCLAIALAGLLGWFIF